MIRRLRHLVTGYLIFGAGMTATRLLMFTAAGEPKRPTLRVRFGTGLCRLWLSATHYLGHGGSA